MLETLCCFEYMRSTYALFSTTVLQYRSLRPAYDTYENYHCLFYEVNSLREGLGL
jgi:hypothetical protein